MYMAFREQSIECFTRALKALLFLYKQVIDQDLEKMNVIGRLVEPVVEALSCNP